MTAFATAVRKAIDAVDGIEPVLRAALEGREGLLDFAACGSTALGVEAALSDCGAIDSTLFHSAEEFTTKAGPLGKARILIGISFSGLSGEVRDILCEANKEGSRTVFITQGARLDKASHNLGIATEGIPRRLLPLVSCLIVHRLRRSRFQGGLTGLTEEALSAQFGSLSRFLAEVLKTELMPLFISAERPFAAKLFSAQYMEFLKRPATQLAFPEWTHDFLWTLGAGDAGRFAFISFAPLWKSGDKRFENTARRIDRLGIAQLVLGNLPAPLAGCPDSSLLVYALWLFQELASSLGLDPETEAGFDN